MEKKLVFAFYLSNDTYKSFINELHFKCLSRFSDIFNTVNITILKDEDTSDDTLLKCKNRFNEIFLTTPKFTINIIDNSPYREAIVFYDKVATKLGEDDLVFFGHNKGITNTMFPKESIIPWILGMYFYNLSFIKEVEELLITDQYLSYGAFLTQNETMRAKYRWNYIGTFFWVNSKALRNYLISQKNSVPPLDNRYYAEEWLGNLYKSWPDKNAASHKLAYLKEAENYYKYTRHYINLLYADISDFKNFYKEITNEEY